MRRKEPPPTAEELDVLLGVTSTGATSVHPKSPKQLTSKAPDTSSTNLPSPLIRDDCLSLDRFPPLPDYLRDNRHRIVNLGAQQLPTWNAAYDNIGGPLMERLRYAFPNRAISREEVICLFESWHDPVLCLVAAMVWGGIMDAHLRDLLAMDEEQLLAQMKALRPLVRSGAFEQAFKDCQIGGSLKFDGVGPAFFTKLFFFIGQVQPVLNPAPLILDKWTGNAFLVLGRQVCDSPRWPDIFDHSKLQDNEAAILKTSYPDACIYRLYVAWFNHWAYLLGVTTAKLEQFVFGMSRTPSAGKHGSNPRNQIIDLGKTLFPPI